MKFARRSLLAGGVAAPLLLASACGGQRGFGGIGSGSEGSGDGASVSLMLVDQDSTKELQSTLIPRFIESSGIHVEVEMVPESGLDAKLATTLGSSVPQHDVIMTGAKNWASLVSSDSLAPLGTYFESSDAEYSGGFAPTLIQNMQVNGALYAMPYQVGAEMLFVNKKAFEQAGLDPEALPTTLEEVVAAAEKIAGATDVTPFVGRGSREGNENSFLWLMLWFLNGGRWPMDDAATDPASYSVLTGEAALTSTQQYYTLMRDYGPEGAANYGFSEAQAAMQRGEAAMWIDAAQLGPALEDPDASTIAGNVGYSSLEGSGDDYNVGAIWGFSIAKGAQDPDSAWELVKYLTSKATGVEQIVSGTNGSPARSDVLETEEALDAVDPEFAEALADAIAYSNPNYTPMIPEGQQIRGFLALELSDGLSSSTSAEDTMQRVQESVEELLA